MFRTLLIACLAAGSLCLGHPMGNFSVNEYTLIRPGANRVNILYAVELAESPAFDLLAAWRIDAAAPVDSVRTRATAQMAEWSHRLKFSSQGAPVSLQPGSVDVSIRNVSAGLPIIRITASFSLSPLRPALEFENEIFPGSRGWKEIVIQPGENTGILRASHGPADRSLTLTRFPAPPEAAPYDLRARVEWTQRPARTIIDSIPQPAPPPSDAAPASARPKKDDFLSSLLGRRDLSIPMLLAGLAVAFGLGAMHALSPGHGKTIVAAYLVGSRGTLRHAALLGGMVTLTHTASVFLLGLGTLFLSQYIVPEKVFPILGTISGLSIVVIGALLLRERLAAAFGTPHTHHHHDHGHAHAHGNHHHHHQHEHEHGPHTHQHYIEGDVTPGNLIALGASGGLVPCPSALVLLLSAVALGRIALGLVLLVSFSLGLAMVLMAIGAAVLYAKNLLPDTRRTAHHPAFRYLPIASAAIIVSVGLFMTALSLGWIRTPGFSE